MTQRPTDQPTNRRAYREVKLQNREYDEKNEGRRRRVQEETLGGKEEGIRMGGEG